MKVLGCTLLLIMFVFGIAMNLSAQENISSSVSDALMLGTFLQNAFFVNVGSLFDLGLYSFNLNAEPGYQFSIGRCIGAGFLNLMFGLGSFTMGDVGGGFGAMLRQAGGIGLTALGAALTAAVFDGKAPGWLWLATLGTLPVFTITIGAIGVVLYAGGLVYGFIRPFSYRSTQRTAKLDDLRNWNIELVSDDDGRLGGRLAFTMHL